MLQSATEGGWRGRRVRGVTWKKPFYLGETSVVLGRKSEIVFADCSSHLNRSDFGFTSLSGAEVNIDFSAVSIVLMYSTGSVGLKLHGTQGSFNELPPTKEPSMSPDLRVHLFQGRLQLFELLRRQIVEDFIFVELLLCSLARNQFYERLINQVPLTEAIQ
ncbi:hypothetical protein EYF80_021433 [Liparis tanakae]|uniref:Uncharacterized protein n=1 Tax=Liparis tanakae TaxID=230148 RepID=A0A4Z2HRX5_9TELE|nr:hypothetical protein EYF80_021433 [Liparis tanakae]